MDCSASIEKTYSLNYPPVRSTSDLGPGSGTASGEFPPLPRLDAPATFGAGSLDGETSGTPPLYGTLG